MKIHETKQVNQKVLVEIICDVCGFQKKKFYHTIVNVMVDKRF